MDLLETLAWRWDLDGWIVLAAVLCALAASLLGNFLVLRRMSMLGDAISHAVLPGLAVAFFVSESRNSLPMFVGAVIVGTLTAFFTQWIHRVGRVDEGASMGVVFTSLFALGLLLIVQAADNVDLDPGCVLYGSIELTPFHKVGFFGWEVPAAVRTLGVVTCINLLFVGVFYKELKIASFDPALATSLGFNSAFIHYLLMVLVAVTAVASFESVGNVLVVAMFVVPPATAALLTRRLSIMILLSGVVAVCSACLGHVAAILVPAQFGFESTTTAGMMAVMTGIFLSIAALFSPSHGILVRFVRRKFLSLRILGDDIVALLYRFEEPDRRDAATLGHAANVARRSPTNAGTDAGVQELPMHELRRLLLCGQTSLMIAAQRLRARGELRITNSQFALTDAGRARAQNLVRSHRLWEQYLREHAGVPASRVHGVAEQIEHFTDQELRERLDAETNEPAVDPHGRPIPSERDHAVRKRKRKR
ncbi:MAG TPA: iron ABC transporter [Planctomycetaceae bacterium]|nr:iron ABC transporter [Planctomycetaceae bacterium]